MAEKALPPAYAVLLLPHRAKDVVAFGKSIVTAMTGNPNFPSASVRGAGSGRRVAVGRPSKGIS
jgi:hypothetical protein